MAKAKTVAPVVIDPQYKTKYVPMILRNVGIGWSHLSKPDTAFGNNKFSAEIILFDQAQIDQAISMGFELKTRKDPDKNPVQNVLLSKKNALNKDGEKVDPPEVVGLDGRTPFKDEIGYGTIANVKVSARAWELFDKDAGGKVWKLYAYIDKVQVIKHVPRAGGGGFDDLSDEAPF